MAFLSLYMLVSNSRGMAIDFIDQFFLKSIVLMVLSKEKSCCKMASPLTIILIRADVEYCFEFCAYKKKNCLEKLMEGNVVDNNPLDLLILTINLAGEIN